jgi:hypothetical protein
MTGSVEQGGVPDSIATKLHVVCIRIAAARET